MNSVRTAIRVKWQRGGGKRCWELCFTKRQQQQRRLPRESQMARPGLIGCCDFLKRHTLAGLVLDEVA